ncbi:MAG: carboxylesterase/lipase family protein [Acidimicrobiia bacterium]|nr:carboxylesterase/lipase family protein [Acidimicrobiia bacterium]
MRPSRFVLLLLALALAVAAPAAAAAQPTPPVVPTGSGPVAGTVADGITVFRGIPYAAPPVEARRWLPPAPVEPWAEVRDATDFAPACPQDPDPHEMADDTPTSEDCLYLNVWTPSVDGAAPVMVFIHGGGFIAGSTRDPWYDGATFAARGVVLVTFQYRLGPLGWLDLGSLGPEYAASGNNGLQDQMAALRWVRENAAAFGGDPTNITVFGESAGAISLSALLGAPAADGLYDRVILESGTSGTVATREWSRRVFDLFVELSGAEAPADVLGLSTDELLDTARQIYDTEFADTAFHPVVDGTILPDLPMRRLSAADGPTAPIIIGTNLDEARYWLYYISELDRLPMRFYKPWLESLVGEGADEVITAYRDERPELDTPQTGMALAGDVGFRMPAIRMAEALSDRGVPVWMYLATVTSPALGGRMGSPHAIELPFVFDNLDAARAPELVGDDPRNPVLADTIQGLWVGFATTGVPAAYGAPAWPQYDRTARTTLLVDRGLLVQDDPYPAARLTWGDMSFDGSDPGLDRLTPLQYEGTPWNDPLVIAAVIGWHWVIGGLVVLVGLIVGVILLVRRALRRRRACRAG